MTYKKQFTQRTQNIFYSEDFRFCIYKNFFQEWVITKDGTEVKTLKTLKGAKQWVIADKRKEIVDTDS